MSFTILKIYCETIGKENTSKLSDIRFQLLKFWIKTHTFMCKDLLSWLLQSRKWWPLCKKWSVSCCLIKPNVWNEGNDAIRSNLKLIHLQSHLFMPFTDSSVRQVVCVKGKFSLLQNVWNKLKHQLPVYSYQQCRHHTPLSGKINWQL
jgi:hypothetical protein